MDLMLLLISKSKQEVTKIIAETSKVEEELKSTCASVVFDSRLQELEKCVRDFEAQTREIKIKNIRGTKKTMPLCVFTIGSTSQPLSKQTSLGQILWKCNQI